MSEKDNWDKAAIIGQGVICLGWLALLVYLVGGVFGFGWW